MYQNCLLVGEKVNRKCVLSSFTQPMMIAIEDGSFQRKEKHLQ